MLKNNFNQIHALAKDSAIKKIKKQLKKGKEFYLLKKLDLLIKNEEI